MATMSIHVRERILVVGFCTQEALGVLMGFNFAMWIVAVLLYF